MAFFHRNYEETYKDEWECLNHRMFSPSLFKEHSGKDWPKIQMKDAEGFRTCANFPHSCQDTMPHINGLEILNEILSKHHLHSCPDFVGKSLEEI